MPGGILVLFDNAYSTRVINVISSRVAHSGCIPITHMDPLITELISLVPGWSFVVDNN